MKEIKVENYRVLIEKGEGDHYVITVPDLPGVIGQVKDEKDAPAEIRRLIGVHFAELASRKPKKGGVGEGNDPSGEKRVKIRRN